MSYKSISKISFFSIIMIILLITGLTIFSITFDDWKTYDNKYLMGDDNLILPVSVQVYRGLMMVSLVMFITTWFASLWEINKISDKKMKRNYFLTGGLFVWTLLPYTFTLALQTKSYQQFWSYLKTKKDAPEQINFYKWGSGFKQKKNRLFWNTTLFLFLLLVIIIDFIWMWVLKEYSENDPNKNVLFNTFSYFTQLSNLVIIFFAIIFSFSHQTIIFRNNTIMILLAAYITVVGVCFWAYLLPFGNLKYDYPTWPDFIKTTWLHGVVPITFVVFTINSLYISKEKPNTFFNTSTIGLVFPLAYGIYAYLLSFVTRYSVYGIITNLNPNMIPFSHTDPGNPFFFFFFFGVAAIFYLFFFIFWKISHIFYMKETKRKELHTHPIH